MTKSLAELAERLDRLERDNRELQDSVAALQKQVRQRELDTAYIYIHSNWQWTRWALVRDQDRAGEDVALYQRAQAAESTIVTTWQAACEPSSLNSSQWMPPTAGASKPR